MNVLFTMLVLLSIPFCAILLFVALIYNNSCEMFPTNIFASLFNFEKKKLFQVSDNEKQPVKAVP